MKKLRAPSLVRVGELLRMIVVIMGVSGSGKSTIAKVLAKKLAWKYRDADNYHNPENIAKMSQGHPLTDADREPWLQSLRRDISHWLTTEQNVVLACSALKKEYRQLLSVDETKQHFVYLRGSPELFAPRLARRTSHFMKEQMLASQFDALEEPCPDEATICDASQPIKDIVTNLRSMFS